MKLQYFKQAAADHDDDLLRKAIADGVVPSSCLLGGKVIAVIRQQQRRPCATCLGPRDKCRGPALDPDNDALPPGKHADLARVDKLLRGDGPLADFLKDGA